MKNIFLMVMLVAAITLSFAYTAEQQQRVVQINNKGFQGVTLDLYQKNSTQWVSIGKFHIPKQSSKNLDIGTDFYFNYGYLGAGNRVIPFYSNVVNFY